MAIRIDNIVPSVDYKGSPYLTEGEVTLEIVFDSDQAEHLDFLFPRLLNRLLHNAGSRHDSWRPNDRFPGHVIYTMSPNAVTQFLTVLKAVIPGVAARLDETKAQNAADQRRIEEAAAAAVDGA